MSKANDRASAAKRLADDMTFKEICAEIEARAQVLFMNANSGIEEWTRAHHMVRAVETFRNAIKSRMDDAAIAEKREAQDRVND